MDWFLYMIEISIMKELNGYDQGLVIPVLFRVIFSQFKISRPQMFFKKTLEKNSAKITGKRFCRNSCFDKVAGCIVAALLERDFSRCFPVYFVKILRTRLRPMRTGHCCCLFQLTLKNEILPLFYDVFVCQMKKSYK